MPEGEVVVCGVGGGGGFLFLGLVEVGHLGVVVVVGGAVGVVGGSR